MSFNLTLEWLVIQNVSEGSPYARSHGGEFLVADGEEPPFLFLYPVRWQEKESDREHENAENDQQETGPFPGKAKVEEVLENRKR